MAECSHLIFSECTSSSNKQQADGSMINVMHGIQFGVNQHKECSNQASLISSAWAVFSPEGVSKLQQFVKEYWHIDNIASDTQTLKLKRNLVQRNDTAPEDRYATEV